MPRPQAIVPVSQENNYIRWLLYGDPGCGKTVFISKNPRTLILDGDGGDATASAKIQGSTAHKWKMEDWDDMNEAYEYVRHQGCKDYDWVWLDSVTLFQETGLYDIMQNLVVVKHHRKVYLPDKGEYGENMTRLTQWVRAMKAVDINFGITAHVLRVESEDEPPINMPFVQGRNMPTKISGHMGLVTYMGVRRLEAGAIERFLLPQKTAKFYGKDRYDALGKRVVNPNIVECVKKVQARLGSPATRPAPAAAGTAQKASGPVKKAASTAAPR